VGLEPTIPLFERGKTVQALDRAATMIGRRESVPDNLSPSGQKPALALSPYIKSHRTSHFLHFSVSAPFVLAYEQDFLTKFYLPSPLHKF
jgi:hypothetical protein